VKIPLKDICNWVSVHESADNSEMLFSPPN